MTARYWFWLIAVLVILALAMLAAYLVWLNITEPSNRATALAAIVQAAAASFIVVLTFELVRTAEGALKVAREQADATAAALEEARRTRLDQRVQREIDVMPMVILSAIVTQHPDGTLGLDLEAHNQTDHPATRVSVTALRGPWDRKPPNRPDARDALLRDAATVVDVLVAHGQATGLGWHLSGADVGEVIVLRLEYSGLLGGTVWQTYEVPRGSAAVSRRVVMKQRYMQPSVDGAEPTIT